LDDSEGVDRNAGVEITSGTYYSLDGTSIYTRDVPNAPRFKRTSAKINRIGRSDLGWKFIVEKDCFPFDVNKDNVSDLENISVVMKWTHKREGKIIDAVSYVKMAEMADNGERIALHVTPTFELPSAVYSFDNADYRITMDVCHTAPTDVKTGITLFEFVEEKLEFEPMEVNVIGKGRDSENWRFVVKNEEFPFEVKPDNMIGVKVVGVYTHKTTGEVRLLESTVKTNDIRADGVSTTLVVPATDVVPIKNLDGTVFDDAPYALKLILAPKDYSGQIKVPENTTKEPPKGVESDVSVEKPVLKFDSFKVTYTTRGRDGENWRFVVQNDALPFDVTEGCMSGISAKAVYTPKNAGKQLILENEVKTNQMRSDGVSTTIVIPATEEVPIRTKDGEIFDDADYDVVLYLAPAGTKIQ
ncbi:MAG: hypothetical protein IKJ55_05015, partial [Clostridia bacterium]|nr:hypothetical protein [Clostridia bacterium]